MAVCPSLTQLHLSVALQCFFCYMSWVVMLLSAMSKYYLQCCFRHVKEKKSRFHSLLLSFSLLWQLLSSFSLLFLSCFFSSPSPPGPHGFQERLAASQEAMKNKNVVNLGAIRQGMKRFQFLLNCCEPGTIPDASILAAALDLVCFIVHQY